MLTLAACLLLSGIADLDDLARGRDVQWSCEASTGRHTLHAGKATIVFLPGISSALVNNAPFALSSPVTLDGGRIKLPPELAHMVEMAPLRRSAAVSITLAKTPAPAPAKESEARPRAGTMLAGTRIVLDPGHGGMHTGGKGNNGLLEKDVNLGVALHLRDILQSWGARVVMTRTTDRHFDAQVDDDLDARVHIVNTENPDLFLSIHTNYVPAAGPRGFEVWVPRCAGARDRDSRVLADLLLDEMGGVWGAAQARGVKDEHNLRVLKGTHCPAALVELEFVSNPGVERLLGQPGKQHDLAAAIAEAARRWFARR
ncbi:MAG TPA: N-acetylmuramoyl-L-alanine amidase [Planctomycetota bacterium]|nr:N-acetylmuramoyl-L-alanine amidase [Planctomycetota bacterium]